MKYGFIGCGNMGGAIARALRRQTDDILICDHSPAGRRRSRPWLPLWGSWRAKRD